MTGFLRKTWIAILLTGVICWMQSCQMPSEKPLTIAAAANLQPVMEFLINQFDSVNGNESQLILNASGKISAQILHGAPYDVFLSADMSYPQQLATAGVTTALPVIYTRGQLVLCSVSGNPVPGLSRVLDQDIRHVALANPEVAPYGRAALECLRNSHLLEQAGSKLVYGESVGQATQFIQSGAAELGFTAGSYRFSNALPSSASWYTIPDSLYQPIDQGAVIVLHNGAPHPDAARFLSYLTSQPVQEIFRKYGYLPVGDE